MQGRMTEEGNGMTGGYASQPAQMMFVSHPAPQQKDSRIVCIRLWPGPTLRQNGINGTMPVKIDPEDNYFVTIWCKNIEFRVQTTPLHSISRDLTVIVPAMPYTSYWRQQLPFQNVAVCFIHPIGTVPNLMYARCGPSHQMARSVHCQDSDNAKMML
jgi:hypothetical protein